MKKTIGIILALVSSSTFAVEGYQDIYLDREKTVYVHGMTCSPDVNQLGAFKSAIVYSNSKTIEKGTYYFNTPYGKFSYTFNTTKNPAVLTRGLLKEGQTTKAEMDINTCIISKINGLPQPLLKSIKTDVLQPNDASWSKKMEMYSMIGGKPAFAKGDFTDPRTAK